MTDKKLHLRHTVTGLIVEVVPSPTDDHYLEIKHGQIKTKIPRTDVANGKWEAVD